MVKRLIRHPQTGGGHSDDVLTRPPPVTDHIHPEEGAHPVVCVQLPEDAVVVPAVQVEGPQHVPSCTEKFQDKFFFSVCSLTSEIVDDF